MTILPAFVRLFAPFQRDLTEIVRCENIDVSGLSALRLLLFRRAQRRARGCIEFGNHAEMQAALQTLEVYINDD